MIKVFAKEIDLEVPVQLKGLVLCFIIGETIENYQGKIPIYPTGFPLIVNIFGDVPKITIDGKDFYPPARTIVAGQIVNVKVHSDLDGVFGQLGVILHPTAPYYLFHNYGEDLSNKWTPLEEVSPVCSRQLVKNLSNRNLPVEDRLSQILTFLKVLEKQRLPPIDWLEEALLQIFERNGNIDQKELLENSGLGARHFRRVFGKILGIPPKYFCKIVQMNTAFEVINSSDPEKLHHIALDCGYYDQSHFIHDFHKMFGVSPEKFLSGKHSFIKDFMGRRGT